MSPCVGVFHRLKSGAQIKAAKMTINAECFLHLHLYNTDLNNLKVVFK